MNLMIGEESLSLPRVLHKMFFDRAGLLTTRMNRDKRIFSTGCSGIVDLLFLLFSHQQLDSRRFGFWVRFLTGNVDENMKLTDCYYDKKDWRVCSEEVNSGSSRKQDKMLTNSR